MQSSRSANSTRDCSRLKITQPRWASPTASAKLQTSAVLPMDGRAASTSSSDGRKPLIMSSSPKKPVFRPDCSPSSSSRA